MKWLLVTTIGTNPGDEMIRLGVQNLISKIDSNAQYELLNKESKQDRQANHEFDKAVWCGMPVFWSIVGNHCSDIVWWPMFKVLGKNPRVFMVVGAGSFFPWEKKITPWRSGDLKNAAIKLNEVCWKLYARDKIVPQVTGIDFEVCVCPAAFAVDPTKEKTLKVCNFMPDGAHYRKFGERESARWRDILPKISEICRNNGFVVSAHSADEYALAKKLGWPDERIYKYVSGKPELVADVYSRATCYVGNRVHGAICAAAAGAEVISIGYDTRQEAVKLSGATCLRPSEVDLNRIEAFSKKTVYEKSSFDYEGEFDRQLKVFKEFAK